MTGRMTPIVRTPSTRGTKPGLPKMPGSGRQVGSLNKVTLTAKLAIAEFVDGNAHRLTGWLDAVADGTLMLDAAGNQVYDDEGNKLYVTKPNPEKAFNLFQSVVEYHVPKLARSEVSGINGSAIEISASSKYVDDLLAELLVLKQKESKTK